MLALFLNAHAYLLFSKLCQHNLPTPSYLYPIHTSAHPAFGNADSLIWMGLYTFTCVRVDSSQTVLERHNPVTLPFKLYYYAIIAAEPY